MPISYCLRDIFVRSRSIIGEAAITAVPLKDVNKEQTKKEGISKFLRHPLEIYKTSGYGVKSFF
jgi:hypothetical protein